MKRIKRFLAIALAASAMCAPFTLATVEDDVARLQQGWERVKYQTAPEAQEQAFEALADEADRAVAANPGRAEALIWAGIIEASYAGAKGGLGALGHVKKARKEFEQAIGLDANALGGSAYISLGSLYYQVPGWPVGFGDEGKATEYLKKGLAANPGGIDANFFYGDFLLHIGDLDGAQKALNTALQAAPRPGREVADAGRRKEVETLLQQIAAKRD